MSYTWTPSENLNPRDLRGRPLRYLLVVSLADAGRTLTVRELIAACEEHGVVFAGRASKVVSDALRWEVGWGRVVRLGRGLYRFGSAPRSTMRWIRHRTAQVLDWLAQAGDQQSAKHTAEPIDQFHWYIRRPGAWVPGWPAWPHWHIWHHWDGPYEISFPRWAPSTSG